MTDILMTATEMARRLNVNVQTVYSLIQNDHLPAVKIGRQWRFAEPDITRWLHDKRQITDTDSPVRDQLAGTPEKTLVYECSS